MTRSSCQHGRPRIIYALVRAPCSIEDILRGTRICTIPAIKKCHLPPDMNICGTQGKRPTNIKSRLDIPEASPSVQLALVSRSRCSAYQLSLEHYPVTSTYSFRSPEEAQSVVMKDLTHRHLLLGHRCSETARHNIECHLEIIAKKKSHAAVLTRLP